MIRVLASVLAIMMCAAAFVACGKTEEPAATTTAATTTAATTTEATTTEATTTEATTTTAKTTTATTTTETTTAAPEVEAVKDGLIVFYEDFNSYANNEDTEATLKAIKWTKLFKETNGVYNESDVEFKIVDGRLYYDNWDAEPVEGDTRVRGKDSYYAIDMLNTEYMTPIVAGKYSLQYDLEYVDAKEKARYAVIITECSDDGQCYNSFHFRIGGYGNNQCHFYGGWKTYDAFDPATDLYVASTATTQEDFATKGTTIIWKLLGQHYDANVLAFKNIPVTILQRWDPEMGHSAWMKTADMKDFVKVTEPSVNADGPMYVGGWDGCGVQLKIGATIDGYIDNIVIWTGHGDKPAGTAVTYKPAA
jgi:hypothetical protein